jgi:uncharacterized membrane protein
MFDQFQGPMKHEPRWFGLKMLLVGAVAMLLSLGLCGVASVSSGNVGGLSVAGLVGFVLSSTLIVVAAIVTVLEMLLASGRNLTERLRDKDDE